MTPTQTNFKIWILCPLRHDARLYSQPELLCNTHTRRALLNLFQNSWKIYVNQPNTVQTQMKLYFNMELIENAAFRDGMPKKEDIEEMEAVTEYGVHAELATLPKNCSLDSVVQKYLAWREAQSLSEEFLNLNSFIGREAPVRQNYYLYQQQIEQFQSKLKFGLGFFFCVLKQRLSYEQLCSAEYLESVKNFVTEGDFYNLVNDSFAFLKHYTLNPLEFLDKILHYFYEEQQLYNYSTFCATILSEFVNKFVFQSIDKEIHLHLKDFYYELYDFQQGLYRTVEEGISKSISFFPKEDPIELLGFDQNIDILIKYRHAQGLLNKILEIERQWSEDPYHVILERMEQDRTQGEDTPATHQQSPAAATQQQNLYSLCFLQLIKESQMNINLVQLVNEILGCLKYDIDESRISLFDINPDNLQQTEPQLEAWVEATKDASITQADLIRYKRKVIKLEDSGQYQELKSSQAKSDAVQQYKDEQLKQQRSSMMKMRKKILNELFIQSQRMGQQKARSRQTSQTTSQQSSEELQQQLSDEQEDHNQIISNHLNQHHLFKVAILNEILLAKRVIYMIQQDLRVVKEVLQNQNMNIASRYIRDLIRALVTNRIPPMWQKHTFITQKKTLHEFIHVLLIKYEHLIQVINRHCSPFPVIPLYKMFDPFGFIMATITQYCIKNDYGLYEVKLVMKKLKRIESEQPSDKGIIMNGLFLRGARYNFEKNEIEDAHIRQFEQEFPTYKLCVEPKLIDKRPEVYNQSYEPNISVEFQLDSNYKPSYDLENEYYF